MRRHLVKAMISRKGGPAAARYVPSEIFELWRSHMSSAYGYEVVEAEPGEWSPARGEAPALERVGVGDCVARVIVTRRAGGIPTRVERFFLASELDAILPKFLAHYGINPARSEEMSLVDVVRGTLRPAPGSGKAVG